MNVSKVVDVLVIEYSEKYSKCSYKEYLSKKIDIIEEMEYLDVIRELDKCNYDFNILGDTESGFSLRFCLLMGICEKIVKLNEPKIPPFFKCGDLVVDKSQNVFYVMNFINDDYYCYADLNGKGFCMEQKEFESNFKKIGETTNDVKNRLILH